MKWLRTLLSKFGVHWTWELPTFCPDCQEEKDRFEAMARKKKMEQEEIDRLKDIAVSRDARLAHPELIKRFTLIKQDYEATFPGRIIILTCTYRSPEEQRRLFNQSRNGNNGPWRTNSDGFNKKSDHNYYPARAIDTAILDGGKAVWDESYFYSYHALAKKHGLLWGGDWINAPHDYPHLYLPQEVV